MMRYSNCAIVLALALNTVSSTRADEAEDRAAQAVEKLGGRLTRDESKVGKPVSSVDLYGTDVTEDALKELAPLTKLTRLNLSHTTTSDAATVHLASLKNLTALNLNFSKVTSAGLKNLAGLKKLSNLELRSTAV